jgi:hypothetical protein
VEFPTPQAGRGVLDCPAGGRHDAGLAFGKSTDDTFVIPGAESQSALDELDRLFPELSGTFAQFVLTVPDGQTVDAPGTRRAASIRRAI